MSLIEKIKSGVNVNLWKWIATISCIFAILMCFLVIANYIQINRLDPVNTEAINTLVVRLSENPNDEALRNEIRALDLLVRKAYFTNQWQVRTGGYILLVNAILMIIAIQILNSAKPIDPVLDNLEVEADQFIKRISRKWISIGGISIIVIALLLSFLTHDKLQDTFTEAAKSTALNETELEGVVTENRKLAVASSAEDEKPNINEVEKKENIQNKAVEESELINTIETVNNKESVTQISEFSLNLRKNYPSFRGANGLGIAYQNNIPVNWDGATNDNILWKVKLNLQGYNSPIIWGDRLFITGANSTAKEVYCYHKNTGELIWTKRVGNIPGSPATVPNVTEDTGLAAPTAATDGKNVYAIFANGDVIALDMSGNQVWAKNLGTPQNHYGHSSSLLVYENKLIIQYDQGRGSKIMALDSNTGDEIWGTARNVQISWASPVIVHRENQTEIVVIADPSVAGFDVNTGQQLWIIDCIYGEVGPSVAYSNGIIFALNEYASLLAISGGNNPEVLWEDYDYLSDVPSPVASNDLLFVATSYGVVVCHNAKTGEKYWEHEFDNGFYASPILVDGKIYLIDRDGIMQIFSAKNEFELIGTPALGEHVVSSPAFADGQIFIRAEDHLYCIGSGN
ncbi:MAG: PQQ-binding-like beta-propeller repeat protein [Bacteroidetes bacterium]|nr:PQQ-binding-like beta-propeller repeat protein [Bacteroidota bacterium]